ncbi:hypothetical protein EGH24_13840 [Halonotius terrestris]|uniref:Uncharacterized protein n=1 Tax=Halonotius terrestris TaxID=2487750 RepID=A0A8J8PA02_9EURY|nr:hypothetical protein [Halonotius terrestris]TQQ78599.1 hypothetical protein EGH24_13840 [Halonotius terrestris]
MPAIDDTSPRALAWNWWPLALLFVLGLGGTLTPIALAFFIVLQIVWLAVPRAARAAGTALGRRVGSDE